MIRERMPEGPKIEISRSVSSDLRTSISPAVTTPDISLPRARSKEKILPRNVRNKLAAVGLSVATAFGAGALIKSDQAGFSSDTQTHYESSRIESVAQIFTRIKNNFGIEIPAQYRSEFTEEGPNGEREINYVPSLEQALVIEAAIEKLPSPGYFAQLIIPRLNEGEGAVAGGSFLGQDWPYFLRRDVNGLSADGFPSEISAIELMVPAAENSAPLPTKGEGDSALPLMVQLAVEDSGIIIDYTEEVPWTTHGERLQQTVIHEFLHGVEDKFSLANSTSFKAYREKMAFTLFGNHTWDIDNPLYTTFAKVAGWKLINSFENAKQYDPVYAEKYLREKPEEATTIMFWEKDPAIWGDLNHRKPHLTIYNTYGPIQESIAETWVAYYLYPHLLNPNEFLYFQNLDRGLRQNPESFISQVVQDPNILLDGIEASTAQN